jgi:DNA-binding NtrC family response regulator
MFATDDKATRTNITVSVTGETGREKAGAKAIHYNSNRAKKHSLP